MLEGLFSLDGQVAVVIGGGGVLGSAMAEGLAGAGADVAILDVNLANAAARAQSLEAAGRRAIAVLCDATRKADLERAGNGARALRPRGRSHSLGGSELGNSVL